MWVFVFRTLEKRDAIQLNVILFFLLLLAEAIEIDSDSESDEDNYEHESLADLNVASEVAAVENTAVGGVRATVEIVDRTASPPDSTAHHQLSHAASTSTALPSDNEQIAEPEQEPRPSLFARIRRYIYSPAVIWCVA